MSAEKRKNIQEYPACKEINMHRQLCSWCIGLNFGPEPLSTYLHCVSEKWRLWWDWTYVQASLSLSLSWLLTVRTKQNLMSWPIWCSWVISFRSPSSWPRHRMSNHHFWQKRCHMLERGGLVEPNRREKSKWYYSSSRWPYCTQNSDEFNPLSWERSGSVVECLTWDRRAAGLNLTGVTVLWSLSKTQLS